MFHSFSTAPPHQITQNALVAQESTINALHVRVANLNSM